MSEIVENKKLIEEENIESSNEKFQPLEKVDTSELAPFDKNKTFFQRLQRKTDKFVLSAREISSRGTSFLIAMLGVVLQAAHTSLLMYDVSGFSSVILRVIVALGIGLFVSSALAIFTIKSNGKDKKILKIVNIFFYFEVFTNIFYYFNSLVFSKVDTNLDFSTVDSHQWLYLIIAIPFAYIVPFTIKQFAGIISADEKLAFGSIEGAPEVLIDMSGEQIDQLNNATSKITDLISQNEQLRMKIESLEDYSEEVRNIKKDVTSNYVKKGETFILDVDGKKSSMTIK